MNPNRSQRRNTDTPTKTREETGPPGHLRPIILLSVLRKILAICLLLRNLERLKTKIPLTQSAYQSGRSTTEQVCAFKILAEKAITSADYKVTLLMLDMSKAFDTVKRRNLVEILREFLPPDELHMMKILIEDVRLRIRIRNEISEPFITNIGVPQGDCLSPIFFIIYLAEALQDTRELFLQQHLEDHTYCQQIITEYTQDQKYADNIGYATTSEEKKEKMKSQVPSKLKDRNLIVNNSKTEEYEVHREGTDDWHKCKYLGSHLHPESDIKRSKILAQSAYNKLKDAFESKKVSVATKNRLLTSHVQSIFLYNSELWTIMQKVESVIDVFQRNLLRQILNVKWPKKISNEKLYQITKQKPWSIEVKRRRLNWYGHMARLPEKTPAKRALREFQRYVRKPRGRTKTTWVETVQKGF